MGLSDPNTVSDEPHQYKTGFPLLNVGFYNVIKIFLQLISELPLYVLFLNKGSTHN